MPDGLSAYSFALQFYPARMRHADSRLVAMADAVAQLEHLQALERAERITDQDGMIIYRRSDESAGKATQMSASGTL